MKQFKKIYIEITNICNKNCSFCTPSSLKKKSMTLEEFEHILKQIKPYSDYIYLHVKGEPLLHPNFKEILELCTKYKIYVNITTNGTFLNKNKEIIQNANCVRQINISFQSFETSTEKSDELIDAVSYLLENTSIYICYRFWALKDLKFSPLNEKIIEKIVQKHKLETKIVDNIYALSNIKLKNNLFLNKDILFEWPSLKNKEVLESSCYGLRKHLAILVDGTVVPCCLDSEGIINLGNIFEKPLKEILQQERVINIVSKFQQGKCQEELCKRCSYRRKFKKMI